MRRSLILEAWAPGMTKSLQDLRREIENDVRV
jgi:hypothetical protein